VVDPPLFNSEHLWTALLEGVGAVLHSASRDFATVCAPTSALHKKGAEKGASSSGSSGASRSFTGDKALKGARSGLALAAPSLLPALKVASLLVGAALVQVKRRSKPLRPVCEHAPLLGIEHRLDVPNNLYLVYKT